LSRISDATLTAIQVLFPEDLGAPAEDEETLAPASDAVWTTVSAPVTGYLISVSDSGLLEFAKVSGRVVRMEAGIGEVVIEGRPLATLSGSRPDSREDAEQLAKNDSFDRQRTLEQDATFGLQQIVDIAVKALSPGVNDASTAVLCIDRITQILACLAVRRIETLFRASEGELRVVARGPSFSDLVHVAYGALRSEARGNAMVLMRLG